jgi:hypothetical protein
MKYTAFGITKQSNSSYTLHMTQFIDQKDAEYLSKSNLGFGEVQTYWHIATEFVLRGQNPLHAFNWDVSPIKLNHEALCLSEDGRELYRVKLGKKITWEEIAVDSRRYTLFDWAMNAHQYLSKIGE